MHLYVTWSTRCGKAVRSRADIPVSSRASELGGMVRNHILNYLSVLERRSKQGGDTVVFHEYRERYSVACSHLFVYSTSNYFRSDPLRLITLPLENRG